MQCFEAAAAQGAIEVAVFATASESFSLRNINSSIAGGTYPSASFAWLASWLTVPTRTIECSPAGMDRWLGCS